jgi:hypothetical protein
VAELVIDGSDLVVRLSPLEKLGAFRGNVRVPVSAVRAVRVSAPAWSELRGIRAPGTGWPGAIALGTRRGGFGRDFAAVSRDRAAVVVELEDAPFGRLVICTPDAEATAARIEALRP